MVLSWRACAVYIEPQSHTQAQGTHTQKKHISFTHSADMHTLAEHSFEPAADIQVTLDHFIMFFISICLSSTSFFFLGSYLHSIFHTPPHISVFFSPPLSSLSLSPFLSLFSLSDVSWTNWGVWNASVLTCILWFGSSIVFSCKTLLYIYCRACSHTAQAYAGSHSAYIIG